MGFASALIVMNVFSPLFDSVCENVLHVFRHKDTIVLSFKNDFKKKKDEPKPVMTVDKKAEEIPLEVPSSEEEFSPDEEIDLSVKEENGEEAFQ